MGQTDTVRNQQVVVWNQSKVILFGKMITQIDYMKDYHLIMLQDNIKVWRDRLIEVQ